MGTDHLAFVRSEAAALLLTAREAPLDTPVPACPGWDLAQLVRHCGRVFQMARLSLTGPTAPDMKAQPRPPEDPDGLLGWYLVQADSLTELLEVTPPESPAWNFTGEQQVAGFWPRRMAVETAIHRWDAQLAAGREPAPIDTALAVDGIDEALDLMAPRFLRDREVTARTGTIHLHTTDAEGEWTFFVDPVRGLVVERGHAKGDAAVRGPAAQLLLWVWHRVATDASGLETFGSAEVVEQWLALNVPG